MLYLREFDEGFPDPNRTGWGAGLVLRIFLALLPILLRLMGRVQGLYSQSMLDFSVVTKYYIFQARAAVPPASDHTPACWQGSAGCKPLCQWLPTHMA